MVSALGAKTAITVTDRNGRFEFPTLTPGPYLVRVHVAGYLGSRGEVVEVRARERAAALIALQRVAPVALPSVPASLPVLAAGLGAAELTTAEEQTAPSAPPAATDASERPPAGDDHGELAWRLRHLRRGVLKEGTLAGAFAPRGLPSDVGLIGPLSVRSTGPSAGVASNLFAGVPLTGQFNFVTTGSFDSPRQLFSSDNFSRSITHVSLAAPVGDSADWSMRGAVTQGDVSSWFVAGAYATRLPARHRYDLGLSYSTQRYDGGNPAALREVTDGSRNAGAVYGFDTFSVSPAVSLAYGARFSRYDYLATGGLLSPRVELTVSPFDRFRLSALASSRALAPGAEEFLPPIQAAGLWLPPQRTFSSIVEGRSLRRERTEHVALSAERDFGASTITMRAFHQRVDDQLVTVFGFDMPGSPEAQLGHYLVGNTGDIDATGWGAGFRTTFVSRVQGSVEYSLTQARWSRTPDAAYLLVVAPSVVRPDSDRVHDVSTTVEANLPETSTRILVVARVSNSSPAVGSERSSYDSRFDVQLHQSLPFMDFSTARWEMLLAVRNAFHEAAVDSSVFDELMVVRPPKRIVGGLTLRF